MKIGVIEWNVGALGGRQRTMLAFADYFLELGHDVRVYTDFSEPPTEEYNAQTFLSWYNTTHLEYRHISFCQLQRRYPNRESLPPSWAKLDVLLVPYGGYGYLQAMLPGVRVITWVIHPDQARFRCAQEVWTNSHTTVARLEASPTWADCKPKIVIPPHDYSAFRGWSMPAQRPLDAVCVGSMLKAKGLLEFADVCRFLDLRGAIISSTWAAAEKENEEVLRELALRGVRPDRLSEPGRVSLRLNIPTKEVAQILGMSKLLVSFSRAESCPLTIYEAMNAGTIPVTRDVGAIREQTGGVGFTFRHDNEALDTIKRALATAKEADSGNYMTTIRDALASRGESYDRSGRAGDSVKEALR